MFEAICIGNLNFDITFHTDELPKIHEKVRCENVITGLGGAAGNTAYWLAILEHKVGFCGCVGKDLLGKIHFSQFGDLGIDTTHIKKVDINSGLAVVFSKRGNKRIIKSTGANAHIQVDEVFLSQTRHIHLSSNVRETVEKVIEFSRQNQITVSYDPAENQYPDLIDKVDYLILNEDEARQMSGSDDIESVISTLSAQCLIITKNGGGCIIKSNTNKYEIDTFGVKPVDTTGAGDAFDAGFIHGILTKKDIQACGLLGVAAASIKVQHVGARVGNISRKILNRFIADRNI